MMNTLSTAPSLKPAILLKQRLFFRFSHPWGPTLLFTPMAAALIWASLSLAPRTWYASVSLLFGGLFSWTLIEYILHRFVFHWTQVKEPYRTAFSGLHMAHHRDVEVRDLIIAPPLVSFVFGGIIFLVLWLLSWNYATAMLMLAGVFMGYVAYEWFHYGAHQYQPRFAPIRYLKHYHLRHHFKHPHGTFGVTTPIWDYVFGTSYKPKH